MVYTKYTFFMVIYSKLGRKKKRVIGVFQNWKVKKRVIGVPICTHEKTCIWCTPSICCEIRKIGQRQIPIKIISVYRLDVHLFPATSIGDSAKHFLRNWNEYIALKGKIEDCLVGSIMGETTPSFPDCHLNTYPTFVWSNFWNNSKPAEAPGRTVPFSSGKICRLF